MCYASRQSHLPYEQGSAIDCMYAVVCGSTRSLINDGSALSCLFIILLVGRGCQLAATTNASVWLAPSTGCPDQIHHTSIGPSKRDITPLPMYPSYIYCAMTTHIMSVTATPVTSASLALSLPTLYPCVLHVSKVLSPNAFPLDIHDNYDLTSNPYFCLSPCLFHPWMLLNLLPFQEIWSLFGKHIIWYEMMCWCWNYQNFYLLFSSLCRRFYNVSSELIGFLDFISISNSVQMSFSHSVYIIYIYIYKLNDWMTFELNIADHVNF